MYNYFKIEDLGWDKYFESEFEKYKAQKYQIGRIISEYKGLYKILAENTDQKINDIENTVELTGKITGKLNYKAENRSDLPVVGDWVVIDIIENENKAVIHYILPRKSKFSRKVSDTITEEQIVAANIDTVFIIQGLDNNFNLRRIERYLTMAWESGAKPVIILNKADICEDIDNKINEVEAIAFGVPILTLSCYLDLGFEKIMDYVIKGNTIAFLGSSGVGKSTIINKLAGNNNQKISEVRKIDSKGRHTTTNKQLVILKNGAILIDTPGMRELQLWGVNTGFNDTFPDIEALSKNCHFKNCSHNNEPDCAVIKAVEDNILDIKRLENYRKFCKELDFLEIRQNEKSKILLKQKEKKFSKDCKEILRLKPKNRF